MKAPRALREHLKRDELSVLTAALDYFASNLERDIHHGDIDESEIDRTHEEIRLARSLLAEIEEGRP